MPTSRLATCPCEHCSGNLEFESVEFEPGTRVFCPHCRQETLLVIPPEATKPAAPEATTWAEAASAAAAGGTTLAAQLRSANAKTIEEPRNEPKRLCHVADNFSIIAAMLVVAGVILFAAYLLSSDFEKAFWPIYAGGAAFGLALWFYMVAQIIYIRADIRSALEKILKWP